MDVDAITDELGKLALPELHHIRAWLDNQIGWLESRPGHIVVISPPAQVRYRQELVRCGRAACKRCASGGGHGPYWYKTWTQDGRTRKKYMGKKLPDELESMDNLTNLLVSGNPGVKKGSSS